MKHIKVKFSDGNIIETNINGTREEIEQYYVGNMFNIGSVEDNMQTAISVEFMEE